MLFCLLDTSLRQEAANFAQGFAAKFNVSLALAVEQLAPHLRDDIVLFVRYLTLGTRWNFGQFTRTPCLCDPPAKRLEVSGFLVEHLTLVDPARSD